MTSFDKLYTFMMSSHKTRWKLGYLSITLTVLWCMYADYILKTAQDRVLSQGIVVMFASFASGLTWCLLSNGYERLPILVDRKSVGFAFASIILLAVLCILPLSTIEAAVTNARLRNFLSGPLTNERLQSVAQMANVARINRVQARSSIVTTVATELRASLQIPPLASDGWSAVVSLLNYKFYLTSYSMQHFSPPRPDSQLPLCSPEKEMVMLAQVPVRDSKVQEVEDLRRFRHGIIKCKLILDNNNLKNSYVGESIVEYSGGPVLLTGVRFDNCYFRLPVERQPSEAQTRLVENLLQNNVIEYFANGPTPPTRQRKVLFGSEREEP